ncbi:unnamed protein product [Microthlaspi erraticum]|uniref:Uncharacterized protein n=1 Tax=Microthlaspi erraticum TaxID=1685480 RepID=A0A6D2I5Q9_9BRAS|nr:unnamed protein product [Microthlaspi erraticum]
MRRFKSVTRRLGWNSALWFGVRSGATTREEKLAGTGDPKTVGSDEASHISIVDFIHRSSSSSISPFRLCSWSK